VGRELWGQIEEEEEEEEEDEDETKGEEVKMEDMDDIPGGDGVQTIDLESTIGTASTFAPIPESLDLRKPGFDVRPQTESPEHRDLCRILPETQFKTGFFGNAGYEIYRPLEKDVPKNVPPYFRTRLTSQRNGIEVSLDPSLRENLTNADLMEVHENEMTREGGKRRYEDLSDMVTEHELKQVKKRRMTEDRRKPKYKF
jgi:splicing factor 3B subunit 2